MHILTANSDVESDGGTSDSRHHAALQKCGGCVGVQESAKEVMWLATRFASTKQGNPLATDDELGKLELVVETATKVWGANQQSL